MCATFHWKFQTMTKYCDMNKGSCAISWNFRSLPFCLKFVINVIKLYLNNKIVNFHWKQTNSFVVNDYTTGVGYPEFLPSCALEYTFLLILSCHLVHCIWMKYFKIHVQSYEYYFKVSFYFILYWKTIKLKSNA